jgi:hypothetical protein
MERQRGRALGWVATRIGVGCLLGAATLAGAGVATAGAGTASATARTNTCDTHHTNVMAYDAQGPSFWGTKGYIYINTADALSGLHDTIARTFFVYSGSQTANVEFGWTDKNYIYNTPTPVSDYMVAGATQNPSFWPSFTLNYNSNVRFRIENLGNQGIFRYVIDGQSSPIAYSPTMDFNQGFAVTNSEHYNSCDTMWTDMFSLQHQYAINPGWSDWANIDCWNNTSVNDWYLHKVNATEVQVNQTPDNWGNQCQ